MHGRYIYEQSSAYRKAHNYETTGINIIERWKREWDNRLAVAILSTDMCKRHYLFSHCLNYVGLSIT